MSQIPIFTIGYGARDMEAFLAVLQAHNIDFLIDVRSRPYSRYKPDFSKHLLSEQLEQTGIRYLFMGDQLGGQPEGEAIRTDEGKIDYQKLAQQPFYLQGIHRLRNAFQQQQRVVLMCSEGKPENCHRYALIGNSLEQSGIPVMHIDEKDELRSQQEIRIRSQGGQMSLPGFEADRSTSRKRYTPGDDDG